MSKQPQYDADAFFFFQHETVSYFGREMPQGTTQFFAWLNAEKNLDPWQYSKLSPFDRVGYLKAYAESQLKGNNTSNSAT